MKGDSCVTFYKMMEKFMTFYQMSYRFFDFGNTEEENFVKRTNLLIVSQIYSIS